MRSRRRIAPLGSLIVVLVLSVTACASDTGTPSAGRSTPAPTRSSASPSTTRTAVENVPDKPATWKIRPDGVGPITIGEDPATAVAAVAAVLKPVSGPCDNDAVTFLGTAGQTQQNSSLLIAAGQAGSIAAIAVSATGPRTALGVGVGSTAAAVRAAYRGATESVRAEVTHQLQVEAEPAWLTFQLTGPADTDTVDLVSVAKGGPPNEYCG